MGDEIEDTITTEQIARIAKILAAPLETDEDYKSLSELTDGGGEDETCVFCS